MANLAELQRAAATLPARLLDATLLGDAQALAELEQERASLPALLFHAELAELQEELIEQRAALVAAKAEQIEAGKTAVELAQAVRDAMRRADQHQRTTSICTQRVDGAKQRIREVENRIAELAELQAGYARQQAAPTVRNMIGRNHIPGPARWPG